MIEFKQAVRIAASSIASAKLRSVLTTLGIVIGVAAVITNASLGASFNQYFTNQVTSLGSNFIMVYSNQPNLFYENELDLVKNSPGITGVSPIKGSNADLTFRSETKNVGIDGVGEEFGRVQNIQMEEGSFLKDTDGYAVVLGYNIANEKFSRKIAHRNNVEISFRQEDGTVITKKFKVKGILKASEETIVGGAQNTDWAIYIPISVMNDIKGEKDYIAFFTMTDSLENVREVSDELDERLARNFGVAKRDLEKADAKPYTIFNQAEILEQTGALGDALSSFLLAVALISLLVGSIGIMNIMLVTVTERTQEIGIMKSLGYNSSGILFLFLLESVMVSLFGGILGTVLGGLGAYLLETALKLPPVFPIILIQIGVLISVSVGVVAGVYPAQKAAKMNPVDALRHQ